MRLGFLGAGWWATVNHMPQLAGRDDVQLAAACGLDEGVLTRVRERFGFPFVTTRWEELLEQPLDAVIVTTPHARHFEHARAALNRGLHVMCEKPMTLKAFEAWELARLAEKKERHLLVPYGWHYKPFAQEARRIMEEGAVGEIEFASCFMASPTRDFFSGRGGIPETFKASIVEPDLATWQVESLGGGYGHGQITHSSALLFWLTGLRAKTVSALMTSPNSRVDMYDAAHVTFHNGAIGTVSGAATLPNNDKFQLDLRIFGTKGVLLVDVERERVELRAHDGKHRRLDIPEGEGAYSCEGPPHRFVDLLHGRGTNDSSGEIAARSVELIEAMYASVQAAGQCITIAGTEPGFP